MNICSLTKLPYVIVDGHVFVDRDKIPDKCRRDYIRYVGQENYLKQDELDSVISHILLEAGPEWFIGTALEQRADIILLELENSNQI